MIRSIIRSVFPGLVLAATVALSLPALATTHSSTAPGQADDSAGMRMATMPGLLMPKMNHGNGMKLFASKGCVVCHAVNGVGGEHAPSLDVSTMPLPMSPFDFAAKMWRGAEAMIYLQQEELGGQIELTGQELADIIAFVHNEEVQRGFSEKDIPRQISKLMHHYDEDQETGKPAQHKH